MQGLSLSERASSFEEPKDNAQLKRTRYRLRMRLVEILMPNSKFRLSWELFIFLVIWYNSVVTPIRLFIMTGNRTPSALISADVALDVIFVFDTTLHFFRPYIDKSTGQTITNLKQIRTKYVRSIAFFTNVLACIPILKTPLAPLLDPKTNITLSTNFNILRMIRISHFPAQFEELKVFLNRKGPVNESVFRMGVILFFTQLLMCIFGCFYFGWSASTVGDVCPGGDAFEEKILGNELWIAEDEVIIDVMDPAICSVSTTCDDCPQVLFFVRSVYFLMQTLFTIGYGDTVVPSRLTIEVAMACIFMLFGVFGYGLIIANMTSVLSNIDVVSMRFRHEMDNVNKWLGFRYVPDSLRDRVEMFFTYLERSQFGMLDSEIFKDLPPRLAKDLTESRIPLIQKVPFFKPEYRSRVFIDKISSAMIRRVYTPDSYILYEGEKQREMIIVKAGRVDLYVRTTAESVGTLICGDYIGDYQLLFGTVNQVGARSPDFAEVLVLTFHAFEEVMDRSLQEGIDFRALGGNLRRCEDPGAKETLHQAQIRVKKIGMNVSNIKKQPKSKKLLNMLELAEVKVKGVRILPTSSIRVYWDVFAITAIMFEAVSCPIRFASNFRSSTLDQAHNWTFLIHYFLDAAFILDIYLRLNAYAYISFDGGRNETVVDRDLIRKHYLNSKSYPIDRIAAMPYDVLSIVFGHHTLFRVPKIIRVVQLPGLVSRLRRNLDDCFKVSINESSASGMIMFLSTILIIIWSSAGWNALRLSESAYKSVYWALTTLTTVGYGDFTPNNLRETVYAVIVGAVGATFAAGIIANVTSFFHNVDISEDNIDHKVNAVRRFMENHGRPLEQIKKIQEYFDYTQREQGGINEELLLRKSLPDNLKSNLLIHVTHSMISKCNFFSDCEAGFLRQLMKSLEQRFFGSQSMILTPFIPSDGMYFIKKGTVDLLTADDSGDRVLRRLDVDDYFAEDCLLEHWDENPYLAMSITDCELWHLSRIVFNRLVDDFPHVRVLLTKIARSSKLQKGRHDSVQTIAKAIENVKRKSSFYIHPDNFFIQVWFGLILLVTIYSVVALPFRLAFMENYEIQMIWVVLDYCGDFLLLIDFGIRSSLLAYYDDNHLVHQRKQIWAHYLDSGKMKWHVLSLLPLEMLIIYFPTLCPLWKIQVWSLFRMNKMLRLLEVPALMYRVESTLAKMGVRVPRNAIRVGKLLMVILLSAHMVACVFYMIASFNQYNNDSENPKNWANEEGLFFEHFECPGRVIDLETMTQRYVSSLYWSMATLTTVGYGDITAHEDSVFEIAFATVILIIGTAIYTLVIALLEDIVSQLDVTSSLHKMRTDKVNSYCQLEALPDTLRLKIDAYYDNLWHKQLGVDGKKVLSFFPTSFRAEMLLDMMSPLLRKTYFVKDCTPDFIAHLLGFMKYEMFLPDDTLFHEGERCISLLFIYNGDVDLLTSTNVKFKTVSNCVLGEASFFGFEPHLCSAKAVGACEIFSFGVEDFITCIHDNQLGGQYAEYLVSNKNLLQQSKETISKMIKNLKSSKMEKMMSSEDETTVPKGVILPETTIRFTWDCLLLIQTTIFTFLIPYQISFLDAEVTIQSFVLDTAMDVIFIIDIYAHLRKFAITKDGFLLAEPAEFRQVYMNTEFKGDSFTVFPASTIGYLFGFRNRRYGLLRLFQFVRVRRFGKYLTAFVENVNAKTTITISTAQLRIMQIFFIVLFLCHWFACIFHALGHQSDGTTWLTIDESINDDTGDRYLRSFYWALYTVTTIGYGSIPVITNVERIFAMIVMAIGAIICDAGITAILTSIISMRDQQTGTNNRRIQCCQRYMKSNSISKDTQSNILDYYKYDDTELNNIKEEEILENLSSSLRNEVLRHFCFEPLRSAAITTDMSDGALGSLINLMQPYLAVPNEDLSKIGEACEYVYVLKRGRVRTVDSAGTENLLPVGSVLGHAATLSAFRELGHPVKELNIQILKGKGFKTKYGHPYIIFTLGSTSCRSTIKKAKDWKESISMKLVDNKEKVLKVSTQIWQGGQVHTFLGTADISLKKKNCHAPRQVTMKDSSGKTTGILHLSLSLTDLPSDEKLTTHERSTTSIGYSHLYRVATFKIDDLKQFLQASMCDDFNKRLRGPFLEYKMYESLSDGERISHSWRRPSRPSICTHSRTSDRKVGHRDAMQRPSVTLNECNHDSSKTEDRENKGTPIKADNKGTKCLRDKSLKILPTTEDEGTHDESGPELEERTEQNLKLESWSHSNVVRTKTLNMPSARGIEGRNQTSKEERELSENDRSWDVLADVNGESSRMGNRTSRRATVFIEWTADKHKHF